MMESITYLGQILLEAFKASTSGNPRQSLLCDLIRHELDAQTIEAPKTRP